MVSIICIVKKEVYSKNRKWSLDSINIQYAVLYVYLCKKSLLDRGHFHFQNLFTIQHIWNGLTL